MGGGGDSICGRRTVVSRRAHDAGVGGMGAGTAKTGRLNRAGRAGRNKVVATAHDAGVEGLDAPPPDTHRGRWGRGLLGFLVFLFMDGASNSDASNAVIASAAFAALRLHVAVGKDGLGIGGPVRRAPGVRAAGGHGGRLGEHGGVGLRDALHEPVGRMDWLGAP